MLRLLAAPFAACMVIAAMHCYMGLHIIRRGVIFVDLALAQMAALGAAVALLVAPHLLHPDAGTADVSAAAVAGAPHEDAADGTLQYALSLGFAFLGAGLLAAGRFRDNRVPHEAIIGIVYVVAAAVAMLILNATPHGAEETKTMLLGQLLFVDAGEVWRTAGLYAALAVPHLLWGRRFLLITNDLPAAERAGLRVRGWDFLFYAIFGVMVTQSVRLGGVLVVFSFLIIPAVCAAIFCRGFWPALLFGWGVAVAASVLGFWWSVRYDWPTGAALVAAFGVLLAACCLVYKAAQWSLRTRA